MALVNHRLTTGHELRPLTIAHMSSAATRQGWQRRNQPGHVTEARNPVEFVRSLSLHRFVDLGGRIACESNAALCMAQSSAPYNGYEYVCCPTNTRQIELTPYSRSCRHKSGRQSQLASTINEALQLLACLPNEAIIVHDVLSDQLQYRSAAFVMRIPVNHPLFQ
ncbi:hypothetical protein ACVWW4_003949 [Bradyrhizobium sp. LB7.1]